MKKVITKLHPNIFAWIEFIQREEAVTKAKIQSFRSRAMGSATETPYEGGEEEDADFFDSFKHLTGL